MAQVPSSLLVACVLLYAAVASAADPPPVGALLTLADAVDLAMRRDESVEVAQARLDRALAARREAIASLLPTLSIGGTWTHRPQETVRDLGGTEVVIQAQDGLNATATIDVDLLDAASIARSRSAHAGTKAAQHDAEAARLDLCLDVAESYLAVLAVERVVEAGRRRLELATRSREAAALRVVSGLAPSTERSRAELEEATASLALTQALGSVAKARAVLELQLGEDLGGRLLAPPGEADLAPPATIDPTARADLLAAQDRSEAARLAVDAPWLGFLPTLTLRGTVRATNEAGFTGRPVDASIGGLLSWTLFDGGARYAQAQARAAELREARAVESASRRRARLEIEQARLDRSLAEAALAQAAIRARIARQHGDEVATRFAEGLLGALEAAEASVQAFEAEVDMARQDLTLGVAALRLLRAAGAEPPVISQEPQP